AAFRLAVLLAEAGDRQGAIDGLRARVDAGDGLAADRLAALLARAGDDRLRRFGFTVGGEIASGPTW
ncbi:hypothetical protein FF36_05615, partial [Frankia torreyi]